MEITNNYNLPLSLVNAVKLEISNYEFIPWRIGVTSLIDSPYRRMLTNKYYDQIKEDVTQRLWALLAKSVHSLLSTMSKTTITEFKVEKDFYLVLDKDEPEKTFKVTLVGIVDDWDIRNNKISDWKVTSKYSVDKDKEEWVMQLNIYAYLLRSIGADIDKLEVNAILRDFHKKDTYDSKMPDIPFVTKDIQLMENDEIEKYILDRLELHFSDNKNPCSPEERWNKPDIWAIRKKGGTRAINGGLHKSFKAAEEHLNDLGPEYEIEFRKGEDVRCMDYCSVNNFCEYYKENYMKNNLSKLGE